MSAMKKHSSTALPEVPSGDAGRSSPLAGEATRLNERSEFSRSGGGASDFSATSRPLSQPSPARGEGLSPAAPPACQWHVTPATEADWPGIWEIFHDVVQGGDTYSYAPDTDEKTAKDVWVGAGKYGTGAHAFVVRDGDKVVGTYSLRRNHYGLGSHVANAGYMVHRDHRGQGIARAMCQHSLAEAKRQGCLSMQFNYVVSTNSRAVELWQAMGFTLIGISPKSYRHATLGLVDIYIMHRFLDGVA